MIVELDVNELRSFALLSNQVAEKIVEANGILNSIVSKHDWKCPERELIDGALERIKTNSVVLNEAFQEYSTKITELANGYTDFINEQMRDEAIHMDRLANDLANGDIDVTCARGDSFSTIVNEAEEASHNISNITSLHGSTHGISIMDFSLYVD